MLFSWWLAGFTFKIMIHFLLILQWIAVDVQATDDSLKPIGLNEDNGKDYWRTYGANDLKARLALKENTKIAKNVIIFLGDGMGVQTHTAARIYKGTIHKLR